MSDIKRGDFSRRLSRKSIKKLIEKIRSSEGIIRVETLKNSNLLIIKRNKPIKKIIEPINNLPL